MRILVPLVASVILVAGCGRQSSVERKGMVTTLACDPDSMTIESGPLPASTGKGTGTVVRTGRIGLHRASPCHEFDLPLLASDGSPVPDAELSAGDFRRNYGIVRFALPKTITTIDQADSSFRDSTIAAVYVVHGLDGGHFVDVHLAGPARADSRGTPQVYGGTRITVSLAVGGGAIPVPAPRAKNVVVMEPRDGGVTYPIVIKGYARTFEANVQAWIEVNQTVQAATRTHTTAADWMTTWGEFELTIPSGPDGDITLFVGEESAKDGTPIGVRIPLRASSGATAGGR